MVVIGGFGDKAVEEVESMVRELMTAVNGYQDTQIVESTPPLALAQFDSPTQAMKFIRAQKKNTEMQLHNLWASENRSKEERMRCKTCSKLKKFLFELGGFTPKDVVVSYKTFRVVIRSEGKVTLVASINDNCEVTWEEQELVGQEVRDVFDEFLADME